MLYEDWLQSGQDWSKSSIYMNSLERNSSKRLGKWKMMEFKDVVSKYGADVASQIRQKKKDLEASKRPDEDCWFMKHPEVDAEEGLH